MWVWSSHAHWTSQKNETAVKLFKQETYPGWPADRRLRPALVERREQAMQQPEQTKKKITHVARGLRIQYGQYRYHIRLNPAHPPTP